MLGEVEPLERVEKTEGLEELGEEAMKEIVAMIEVDPIVDMIEEEDLIVGVAAMMIAGVDLVTIEIGGMIEVHLDTIGTEEMIEDTTEIDVMTEERHLDMSEIEEMTEDLLDMTETGEKMEETKEVAVATKNALLTVDVTVVTEGRREK